MEQAWARWVWEGVQDIHSDNLDSEAFYHVKVTFMIEHLSIEFREMLNLKTEFRWYECWEYKESQRLSPRDFTFGTHSLPSGTHSGTVNPGVCSAVPSAASEPVKPSIYTEIINMGPSKRWRNNLDPFFFSVWFIDFLSFWLATGLPFQHLYCVLNKRG